MAGMTAKEAEDALKRVKIAVRAIYRVAATTRSRSLRAALVAVAESIEEAIAG